MATHTFLYDDACPMCKGYTNVFETMRWSKRRGFSTVNPEDIPELDLDRGRHEIPLVDIETGEVRYGLEAMTTVVAEGVPFLRPLIRHPWFIALLKPLYWLITYNRRVIAGTRPPAEGFDCAPDFHTGWRLAYLGLVLAFVALLGFPPVIMTAGFGLATIAGLLLAGERLEYLGHLFTILLMVTVVVAVVPGTVGMVLGYGVAVWEGWRRFEGLRLKP